MKYHLSGRTKERTDGRTDEREGRTGRQHNSFTDNTECRNERGATATVPDV